MECIATGCTAMQGIVEWNALQVNALQCKALLQYGMHCKAALQIHN